MRLKPDSAEAVEKLAGALKGRKDAAKAEDYLRLAPASPELALSVAEVLYRGGKPELALAVLVDHASTLAGAAAPLRAQWLASRGAVRSKLGEAAGARDDWAAAISADARTACLRGLELEYRGRLSADYFDACVGRFPNEASLRLERGAVRLAAGDGEGAVADFRAALKFEPDSKEAAMSLASALQLRARQLIERKELAKAEDDLREAARIDPGSAEGMKNLADVLLERGEGRDARLALDKAVAMVPHAKSASEYLSVSSRLIPLLARTGRLPEALGVADRRVAASGKADPMALSRALAERGMIQAQLKAYDKAGEDFERALGLAPASPEFALSAAGALYRGGKPERALSVLVDRASALAGATPPLRARWLASRGAVRSRLGDAAGAKADWAGAIAADARTACLQGPELEDRGRLSADYFDACVGRFPDEASLRLDRGVARFAAGDAQGAVSDFRAALRLKPDSAEAAMSLETARKGPKAASP